MIKLEKLLGKDFTFLYRASDMLCLQIGETILIDSRGKNGGKKESPEYRIHFQCQWRFIRGGDILLASHDIYNPFDENRLDDENWDWDVFGRERAQSSVFDVRAEAFINEFLPLKIERIFFHHANDLCISFDKNVGFDTFITCSTKREFYRFLDFATGEHTVIFDE